MDGRSRLRGSEQKQRRYRGLPALEWRRDRREEAANRADGEEGQAAPDLGPGFCSVLFALRDCLLPAGVAVVTPSDGVVNVHAHMRAHTWRPVRPGNSPRLTALGNSFFAARKMRLARPSKCLIPIRLGAVLAAFRNP